MSKASLTDTMKSIFELLQEKGPLATHEITKKLKMNYGTVRQNLYLMNKMGVIQHVGPKGEKRGGMGKWKVKDA